MNPDVNAFQRKYVNDVRRCDEMERKLRFEIGNFPSSLTTFFLHSFFQSEIEKAVMKFTSPENFVDTAAPDTAEIALLEVQNVEIHTLPDSLLG